MYTDLEVLLGFGKKQLWLYRRYTCMYSICRYTMIHIKQLDKSLYACRISSCLWVYLWWVWNILFECLFLAARQFVQRREIGECIVQRICRVNLQRTYVSETGLRSFQGHTTVLPKSSDLCLWIMFFWAMLKVTSVAFRFFVSGVWFVIWQSLKHTTSKSATHIDKFATKTTSWHVLVDVFSYLEFLKSCLSLGWNSFHQFSVCGV